MLRQFKEVLEIIGYKTRTSQMYENVVCRYFHNTTVTSGKKNVEIHIRDIEREIDKLTIAINEVTKMEDRDSQFSRNYDDRSALRMYSKFMQMLLYREFPAYKILKR